MGIVFSLVNGLIVMRGIQKESNRERELLWRQTAAYDTIFRCLCRRWLFAFAGIALVSQPTDQLLLSLSLLHSHCSPVVAVSLLL